MARILVTGAGGFLGQHLLPEVCGEGTAIGAYHNKKPDESCGDEFVKLDIADQHSVEEVVQRVQPTAVIHCAAMSAMDVCFKEQELAWRVNVTGTENVARASAEVGAQLVYVSTDLVFGGSRSLYSESDQPTPICFYGKTKLAAEARAASLCPGAVIARCALILGFNNGGSPTFYERSIEAMLRGDQINLFTDEYRSPISVSTVCSLLHELALRPELEGIFHLSGHERLSRYELGLYTARAFGVSEKLIRPNSMADHTFLDARPADCSMTNARAVAELETKISSIQEVMAEMNCKWFERW